jgi:hypothetical protein
LGEGRERPSCVAERRDLDLEGASDCARFRVALGGCDDDLTVLPLGLLETVEQAAGRLLEGLLG